MIEVYGSALSHAPDEIYSVERCQSILDWLCDNGIDRDAQMDGLPISIGLNGEWMMPSMWQSTLFGPHDALEICRMPKGTDPFSITAALIFGAKAVLSALMPKLPSINAQAQKSGDPLDEASSKGNKIKINDVIPECFGHNPARYPDYLVLPYRYFAGPREQRIRMLLSVGIGEYEKPLSKVKIGQTPLISLGSDAAFNFYEPGEDVSADGAHLYYYQVPEVGASSTGASGLELTVGTTLTTQVTATALQFVGDTVTIPSGSGTFPTDWVNGLVINIAAPYAYTVADGTGDAGRDVISGDITQLGFVAGDQIEIRGDNAGLYAVHSATATDLQLDYDGGAPATGLALGNLTMAISFRGLKFRITAAGTSTMEVERLNSAGVSDPDWPGWTNRTTSQGAITLDGSNLEGGFRGWFAACPEGELVTQLAITWFCPAGLIGLGAKGEEFPLAIYVQCDYQDLNGGGIVSTTFTHTANTFDAVGYTDYINLPYPMRPQVRAKKLFVQQGGLRPNEYHDTTMWYSCYALMPSGSKTSYAGITTLACDIRGGDRISSQTESLVSVDCTRILPVLRGGVWRAPQPTREISAAIGYVCRSIGYSDTQDLNIAELERLESTRWTPRGDTYDRIITDSGTVKEYLIEILRAGFSELTIERGVITPVRDEPRGEVFDHVYNPQNMLDPLTWDFQAPDQPDDFDGVDVEYFDSTTLQNETVQCRLPGDSGERVEKIHIDGVGVRFRAWRIGMRQRRSHIYRTNQYSFKTELDALNSGYLDYVALGVTTPGYGQSAFVTDWMQVGAVTMITASESLDWSRDGRYKLVVRRKDGSACGPYIATRLSDNRFTIPEPDFIGAMRGEPNLDGPGEPPFLQIGHESVWAFPALIQSVSPSGTRSCSVKAVNYDERMYLDDDNFPPAGA